MKIMSLTMKTMVVLILTVLVVYVDQSCQLKSTHPLHDLVNMVNDNLTGGSAYIGLVMAFPPEEKALVDSGFFVPSSEVPWIDLSGRRYNIGKIKGVNVIYVMSGQQTLNAGIAVQTLLDVFNIKGIVHYGTAGSANTSLTFGDVSVPECVAFTGSWKWKEFHSEKLGSLPELKFGDYNLPENGDNSLAKIEFATQELYSQNQSKQDVFWLPVEPKWFGLASQLKDMELQRCVNETQCLPEPPKVVHGLRGSTADILLGNSAFREFLFREFKVSTVDEESSAVVMTSLTNGVPCIVFRGVSDLAGGGKQPGTDTGLRDLAAVNALRVAVEFIQLIGSGSPTDH